MGFFERIMQMLKRIFGSSQEKQTPNLPEHIRIEEERKEVFMQVNALVTRYEETMDEFKKAQQEGKGKFILEEIYQQAQRLQNQLDATQEDLRDVREFQEEMDRIARLRRKWLRLTGEEKDEVSGKDIFTAARKRDKKREQAAIDDEMQYEDRVAQEERHTVPDFTGNQERSAELDLEPEKGTAAKQTTNLER